MSPEPIHSADAFGLVSSALDQLHQSLLHPTLDCTPVILLQPPSRRDAHRASIELSLPALDSQWASMELLWQKLAETRKQLKRRQALRRSALSPISALPSELLRQVFAHLFSYLPEWRDSSMRRTLTSVCSEWRNIATTQRALWSSLNVDHVPTFAETRRLLPGSEPLRLTIGQGDEDRDYVSDCIFKMRKLRPRLQALFWDRSDGPRHLFSQIFSDKVEPFVALQVLSITIAHECPSCYSDITHVIGGDFSCDPAVFPNLRTLRLEGVDFNTDGFGGHKLETLELARVSLTLTDLRHILSRVPRLETLRLSEITSPGEQDTLVDGGTSLPSFSHLQQLELDSIEDAQATHLLMSLQCPHLESLVVRKSGYWDDVMANSGAVWSTAISDMLVQCIHLRTLVLEVPNQAMHRIIRALRAFASEAAECGFPALVSKLTSLDCGMHSRRHHDPDHALALTLGDTLLEVLKSRSGRCAPLKRLRVTSCAVSSIRDALSTLAPDALLYGCDACVILSPF